MAKLKKEKQHFFEDKIIETQDRFIAAYMSENPNKIKALRLLFKLYKGHYGKLLVGALIYIIKDSPMWVLPIITANVINLVTNPPENFWLQIIINAAVAALLLLINIPFHTLYVKILSKANRNVEAGLRGAMVRKLQQLSISYHKDTQSGKIQSKVMRDVEVVTDLASHIMNTILGTLINLCITLVVIISNNIVIFLCFYCLFPRQFYCKKVFTRLCTPKPKSFVSS